MARSDYSSRPVANGLSTDHPHPGLPFVDDSHIPVTDPQAVEAVGRRHDSDTWGRYDDNRRHGGWIAYTTDPGRHDLAWVVRWHPDHGRSVLLYRDDDAAAVHVDLRSKILLWRAGGYWWDGQTWYRPARVWDGAGEDYYERPVPGAVTVTADMVAADGDPEAGQVLDIAGLDPDAPYMGRWSDDLALWAERRDWEADPLAKCVVTLTAPELAAEAMIGAADMAKAAGIAQSTLRAYQTRGEGDIPAPQAVVGGRSMWSRPVAQEYAEQLGRSDDGVTGAVSAPVPGLDRQVPVGEADAVADLGRSFKASLWSRKELRSRWALRWRNEASVTQVAGWLALDAAGYVLHRLIPADALAGTIQHAILDEFATGVDLERSLAEDDGKLRAVGPDDTAALDLTMLAIAPSVTRMLDWFIRHYPAAARRTMQSVIGEAERRLGVPRDVSEYSFAVALGLDSKLPEQAMSDFLRRVITPGSGIR